MQSVEGLGVPVLWREAPGPLAAALMFRVGRRDESFVNGGITHLVEHLVMAALGRTHLDCNASVDLGSTAFTATGPPVMVADFLHRVSATLCDLPVGRLATEAAVLQVEGGAVDHPLVCHALARRFGARELGLAGFDEPAVDQISAEAVLEWVRTYFVSENAVLVLTGPPPEGLRISLPAGRRNARSTPTRLPVPVPGQGTHVFDGVVVSFEVENSEALHAGLRVLIHRAVDDLRHGRGLSYHLDYSGASVDGDVAHVAVHADAPDRSAAEAAGGLLAAFRSLAQDGPTEDELEHDLEGMRHEFEDPRSVHSELTSAAGALLAGRPVETSAQILAARERVSAADIAATFCAALPTLLVLLPEDCALEDPALPQVPEELFPPNTGEVFKRRLRGDAPRGSRLHVGSEGMTVDLGDHRRTIRFADCVGVGRSPYGFVRLVGIDGISIPLDAADWRDGQRAVELVLAALPDGLTFDERPDDEHP